MAQQVTDEFIERGEEMAKHGCAPEEADAFCRELTARHYENFPVLSRLLPEHQRGSVCAVYAANVSMRRAATFFWSGVSES